MRLGLSFVAVAGLFLMLAGAAHAQVNLLDSTFNTDLSGWTVTNTSTAPTTNRHWVRTAGNYTTGGTPGAPIQNFDGSQFMLVDADSYGGTGVTINTTATSPTFNGTAATGSLFLRLTSAFIIWDMETITIQVFNGTSWQTVETWTVADSIQSLTWAPNTDTIDITAHKATNNQVRIIYNDPGSWGWFAAFDNVQVFYTTDPLIDVERPVGTDVPAGFTDPIGILEAGVATNVTWTVFNRGGAVLTHTAAIAGAPTPVNCTPGTPTLAASTAVGGSSTLTIPITPTAQGPFSFRFTITSNDPTQATYNIDVRGLALSNPNLFYAGDFDGNDGIVNGRGFSVVPTSTFTYEMFTVPAGQTWNVSHLYSNNLTDDGFVTQADWEIRTGVSVGFGGTVIHSGNGVSAGWELTGNGAYGLPMYTVYVTLGTPVQLTAGTYFIGVRPVASTGQYCFNGTTSGANGAGTPLNDQTAYVNDTAGQFTNPPLTFSRAVGGTANYDLSIGVRGTLAGPSIDITTTTLNNAIETQAYSANIVATEQGTTGPYSWSISSGNPGWLSISGTGLTGVLTGTPPASSANTYNIEVTVTATSGQSDTQALTLTVTATGAAYIDINPGTLPNATESAAYSAAITASQSGTTAPYNWSTGTGAPGWLTLTPNGLTLQLGGTPPAGTAGTTYNFDVTVIATSGQSDTQAFSITVSGGAGTPVIDINTTSLPNATEQVAYTANIVATEQNTTGPYTWSISSGNPGWLVISGTGLTGVLSGTPPAAGPASVTFDVTVTATSGQSDTQSLTLNINPAGTLTITTTTMPNGTVGAAYTGTISATGGTGPYSWSIASGSLPTGLTLGASTGTSVGFGGAPSAAGSFNFTIMITDSVAASATRALTITVTTGGGGPGFGGGGGGGGGGCAAGSSSPWLVLFGVAGFAALALRRRRVKA